MLAATPGMAYAQGMGGGGNFNDYRALVCLFLFGGNDSYNMLVPRSNAEYNVYAQARQNLAVAQNDLLPITRRDIGRRGLRPASRDKRACKACLKAALPLSLRIPGRWSNRPPRTSSTMAPVILPPQLFSHNDQQDQWQSLRGNSQSATGWAGRMADLIRNGVSGTADGDQCLVVWQQSLFRRPTRRSRTSWGPDGPQQFVGFSNDPNNLFFEQRQAFERILAQQYGTVYERSLLGDPAARHRFGRHRDGSDRVIPVCRRSTRCFRQGSSACNCRLLRD